MDLMPYMLARSVSMMLATVIHNNSVTYFYFRVINISLLKAFI